MRGKFILSLDTELLWGVLWRDDYPYFQPQVKDVRKNLPKFLDLLDKHKIKATFAVVGHLMAEKCNDKSCACKKVPKEYVFSRDVIKMIKSRNHDVGLHGYSHKFFDQITQAEADAELKKAVSAARSLGIKPVSFVFPQNREHYKQILPRHGIKVYRGVDEWWFNSLPELLQPPAHLTDYLLETTPPVYAVRRKGKLVNVPGSMFYLAMDGLRKYVPLRSRVNKAKKGIDAAIREGKVFHLWFHPFNISTNPERMLEGLNQIFAYASQKRKEGKLEILTMSEVAK